MGDNPIVKVEKYNFFNSDEAVEITLSYRITESSIWKNDFEKAVNYFDSGANPITWVTASMNMERIG